MRVRRECAPQWLLLRGNNTMNGTIALGWKLNTRASTELFPVIERNRAGINSCHRSQLYRHHCSAVRSHIKRRQVAVPLRIGGTIEHTGPGPATSLAGFEVIIVACSCSDHRGWYEVRRELVRHSGAPVARSRQTDPARQSGEVAA